MSDPSGPLVSILIVNYNGASLLRDCLGSLAAVTYARREVLLVDNGSTDDSLKVVTAFPGVKVIRSDRNLGFAGGNNLGLPHCVGDYVLLLNSDTIVRPDFLEPLVEYMNQNPRVGVAQGKMLLSRHHDVLDVCGSFLTRFGFLYHYGYWKPDAPKYHHDYPVFTAKGACMMIRPSLIPKVGGYLFNEDFFCYYEETDFCHRVWLAGHETHFVHRSVIQHLQGGTVERTQKSSYPLEQFLGNQTFTLLANLSLTSRLTILPPYFAIFVASMVLAGLLGKWATCRAHGRALLRCAKDLKRFGRKGG